MSFLYNKASAAAKNLHTSATTAANNLHTTATNAASNIASTATLENATSKFGLGGSTTLPKTDVFSTNHGNRYDSTFPVSQGTVKFHVDGCAYFWAVSEALEKAKESIWILGCE